MQTFGMRFKNLRTKLELTQTEIVDLFNAKYNHGFGKSAISQYENDKRIPEVQVLQEWSDFFNVTIDYLLGNSNIKELTPTKGVKIPVLGSVVAGVPIEAVTDILDYEEIDQEMAKKGEYFALKVKGSSMEPRMLEGDVVIVRKQSYIESGEIAIVLVNGCDATIKKVIKQNNGLLLVAINSEVYQPTFYTTEDIKNLPVSIIGKVIELRGKF